MQTNQIVIINQSTACPTATLESYLPALQEQVSRDFAPLWGITAEIAVSEGPMTSYWPIYVLDRCGIAADLGFHLDTNNLPNAKVGVLDAQDVNISLSSVISHELLEMLADPLTTRLVSVGTNQYMVEVCDPVSSDAYKIGNIEVASFVTPRYFNYTNMGQYDQLGYMTEPLPVVRPGGYISWWNGSAWTSTFGRLADGAVPWRINHIGRTDWRVKQGNPVR
jgi:hypothetical protein